MIYCALCDFRILDVMILTKDLDCSKSNFFKRLTEILKVASRWIRIRDF